MERVRNKWQPVVGDDRKEKSELPAVAIKMTKDGRTLHIEYEDGVRVIFPTSNVPELAVAKVAKTRNARLSSDGKTISWPDLNVGCSVGGIRSGKYGPAKFRSIS